MSTVLTSQPAVLPVPPAEVSVGGRCVAVLKHLVLVLCLTLFAPNVWAASFNVSDFELTPTSGPTDPGNPNDCVIDGPGALANDGRTFNPADQLSIDRSCTIKNFSCSDPLASTLNFASHVPGTLIIFNNVCYDGNFACANVSGSAFVWAVNGSDFSSVKEGCQDLIIPVEKIDKSATDLSDNPVTSVSVGVPFRYTLDIPILFDPVSGTVIPGYGSLDELGNIVITDDMTLATLGVDLELLGITVTSDTTGAMTEGVDYTVTSSIGNPSDPGVLTFTIINPDPLPANDQIHISIDVVLEDTVNNNIGKIFTNVAEWTFSRIIDGTLYDPLPGENGVAQLLSISQPDLLVVKTTTASAVNFSDLSDFSILTQNIGGAPAWNIVVEDQLPLEMRDFDPSATVAVTLDGNLLAPADYVLDYSLGGSPGLLTVELLDSAGALAPNAILRIDYSAQLDQPGGSNEPADGDSLINVAAATVWYNDISTNGSRVEYTGIRTDGTDGVDDNQDLAEITAALTGYYFEKTVSNVTTGISPAATAIPGDRLRYRVRLFNLDQEIYDVSITDQLDPARFDVSSAAVDLSTCPVGASTCAFDGSGLLTISGDIDVAPTSAQQSISIEFEVDLLGTLADGDVASNQAMLTAADVDAGAINVNADSDDPNLNGVINQADPLAPAADTTDIAIIAPGALLKANPVGVTQTPIGQVFNYTLTVPQTAVNAPLYDVQIQDALPAELVPATMLATATIIDGAGTPTGTSYNLTVTNTGSGLVLSEGVTGLDLAAGERAQIDLAVQVANVLGNQDAGTFANTATYTYARLNGAAQSDPTGTDGTTAALTIVEPDVTALKTVINLDGNTPAQGGDTLEYTVTLTGGGTSTAFDTSIIDTLPAGLTYVAGSAEITLNAATTPVEPSVVGRVLTWGSQNADDSLDIPVGEDLVLTYQVLISDATGPDLINLADISWSSLDGAVDGERSGADSPDTAALNNYFVSATSSVTYADTTSFDKTVQADSWDDGGVLSTGTDGIVRVGDTVTYALTLGLREGVTSAVTVTDSLPTGLEVVSVNYVFNGGNISFTPVTAPAAGERGVLSWDFGDITNTPDAVTSNDTLVIALQAVVVANDADTLAQLNTTLVGNAAALDYTGAAAPLPGQVDITVNQPVMSAITKIDTAGGRTGAGTNADPYQIDLVADTMSFQLETCNNGDAPAYNLAISDTLAGQLDEADLAAAPTVTLGGAPLTAVTDFTYTAPARAGAFTVVLNDGVAVDPTQCLVVSYNVGFHSDVITNTAFNNNAALDDYWSLDVSAGQEYPSTSAAQVWMINNVLQPLPVKDVIGQLDGVAVIGETVTYTVTVPADNINRASVVVTDTLPSALAYDSASATVNALPVVITDNTVGQDVSIDVGDVPAGQDVVVTINTHVVNTASTNGGDSIDNLASYSYTGLVTPLTSAAAPTLTIVEPLLGITKAVANLTNPGNPAAGGDELEYTITLTNSGNSTAFDSTVTDTLPTGLTLIASSATAEIGPAGSTVAVTGFVVDPAVSGSDLIWGDGNGDGTLDIPAGEVLVLSYRANVADASIGSYTNSALTDWSSIDAASALERTGAGCPTIAAPNDYCAGPATANITSVDTTAFAKLVIADSWDDAFSTANDSILRVGDTVDYQLTLTLREGLTSAVSVSDTLPAGLVFDSVIAINGDNAAPYSNVAPFTHGDIAAPSVVGGVITWGIGDITNAIDNNTANDSFVIQYRARVASSTLAQANSTTLANAAALNYDSGTVLNDSVDIDVRQPVISAITKLDGLGNSYPNSAAPLAVDIANDTMSFALQTCNAAAPAAPAYNLQLVDTLATQLDEASIANLQVVINGAAATAGVDYTYTAPAVRGGSMIFDLLVPLQAGQCATVDYDIGFYTDVAPNQTWANSVSDTEYWSLPTPTTDGEQYALVGPAELWMTNATVDPLPVKTVLAPVSPDVDVTIGENVSYAITIAAVNAQRDDVQVTDTLPASLVYDSATATVSGAPAALTDNTAGQDVDLTIASVPAGQEVVITLNAYVANIAATNDGNAVDNTATYTYNGYAGAALTSAAAPTLTIVEPLLTLTKAVANVTNPGSPAAGGDTLEYTLTMVNTGNAIAHDVTLTDTLPTGLNLVASSATAEINSVAVVGFVVDPTVNGADLIWGDGNADGSLDVPVGETLLLTFEVTVGNASGALDNSAVADWTSLDAANARERTGAGCPVIAAPDDYCVGPAIASIDTAADIDVVKTVTNITTGQPGTTASPGDVLEYTITIDNRNSITLPDFSFVDAPGVWNTDVVFALGSMTVPVVGGSAYNDFSDVNGGTNGAGLVDLRNLSLGPDGGGADIVTVTFRLTLASVITNGTVVENQSVLSTGGTAITPFDPAQGIAETVITSAPLWQVEKISDDLTDDPAVLEIGDTLRYTITVANIGNEDAIDVLLSDAIPNFTAYVAGSTTLNGVSVADSGGTSALVAGMAIEPAASSGDASIDGIMPADPLAAAANTATISFSVTVNGGVVVGTIISNQGFVYGTGAGGMAFSPQPSDDPATVVADDPTRDIVGGLPLLDAQKTVAISDDVNGDGVLNAGDSLRYYITITNSSATDATNVTFSDPVPTDTLFVPGSVTIDSLAQPDPASLPTSVDLTLGAVAGNTTVLVTFDVTVNAGVAAGTVISNQGTIDSTESAAELTDADGIDANGDQPTTIIVGSDQQLSIVKSVTVVGGGVPVAGSTLEYLVLVTNSGVVPATDVQITDDLNALIAATQGDYVAGSATLNGDDTLVVYAGQVLSADYMAAFGALPAGDTAALRFRVVLDASVVAGDTISNTGTVYWNNPPLTASSTVDLQVGFIPGVSTLTGAVWHDANFDDVQDGSELSLSGWGVALYFGGVQQGTTITDTSGAYSFAGVAASVAATDVYELRFSAPSATATTASLGYTASAFTNGLQRITDIVAPYSGIASNLNLPIDPNGVVYDSILRAPIAGATLRLVDPLSGAAISAACFADPAQQGQVTLASGYYKFDLTFNGDPSCPTPGDYLVEVTPPSNGFVAGSSQIIPPLTDASTAAYSVPACAADAVVGTRCEAQASEFAPGVAVTAADLATGYYLHMTFSDTVIPDDSQLFNNHIPLDPTLANSVGITKISARVNVSRGELVPYVITVRNTLPVTLTDMNVIDTFPTGFKYVADSARLDGVPVEPVVAGRQLSWSGLQLQTNSVLTIKLLLVVSSGVSEGEYVNRAQVFNTATGAAASAQATATVRVVPDPTFDCTDVIGKVFDDANYNGVQDGNEKGLPGVRLATVRGLLITTDKHGRYHITCAAVPDENRGSNFIVKVDDRSLPTGYRMTTENPRVQRVTRGKMMKFNFGAALHRVVRIDMADGVFESDSADVRRQWKPRLDLLMTQLDKAPSILRVAYMAEIEKESLVEQRLDAIKDMVREHWRKQGNPYELVIETEIFWRTGAPPVRRAIK